MKSKRNRQLRKKMRKTRKGGFFFRSKKVVPNENCDPNKLEELIKIPDYIADLEKKPDELRNKYIECCPKKYFGLIKNRSPYCKVLDKTYKHIKKLIKEETNSEPLQELSIPKNFGSEGRMPIFSKIPGEDLIKDTEDKKKEAIIRWYPKGGKKSRTNKKHSRRKSHMNH